MKNEKHGFTLLEIMTVFSVIGLLAGLGTFAMSKAIRDSRINKAKVELEMIATATLQLAWDTGKWPNNASRTAAASGENEVWDLAGGALFRIPDGESYPDWRGPYYEGELEDPWGESYFFDSDYRVDGVNRIAVGSHGPNGFRKHVYDKDNIYVLLDD